MTKPNKPYLGLFNCIYLTQFLMDVGQILDSEPYDQVCNYVSVQVFKYASMQVYTYMQLNAKLSICPQLRHFFFKSRVFK